MEIRGLYRDAIPVDDENLFAAPATFVADLRVGLTDIALGSTRASPFLAISNLLDRRYVTSVVVNAFGGRFFEPGPGRTLQMGVDVRLGR